jgi:hypothetical protein
MTDTKDVGEISAEKKIVLNTSFNCPNCASGAEHYSELFDHGTCVNCGAPLEQFSATLTEKGEQEIKSSLLLLYSKDDMAKTAEEVVTELGKDGIRVVDAYDIIDGSKTLVLAGNLAFVMGKTAAVLVIPSEHLEDDQAIATCLGEAIVKSVNEAKKIIPIYTAENITKASFGLVNLAGVNWDGKVVSDMYTIDKSRVLPMLHDSINENILK